jgi:hypothetical protein
MQARGAEGIDHAGHQRHFRADDGQPDALARANWPGLRSIASMATFSTPGFGGGAGIAGGDEDGVDRGAIAPPSRPARARGRRRR